MPRRGQLPQERTVAALRMADDMIISSTPTWPSSRKWLRKVMAGAIAAMKRYRSVESDFCTFSPVKASVQSLAKKGARRFKSARRPAGEVQWAVVLLSTVRNVARLVSHHSCGLRHCQMLPLTRFAPNQALLFSPKGLRKRKRDSPAKSIKCQKERKRTCGPCASCSTLA